MSRLGPAMAILREQTLLAVDARLMEALDALTDADMTEARENPRIHAVIVWAIKRGLCIRAFACDDVAKLEEVLATLRGGGVQ